MLTTEKILQELKEMHFTLKSIEQSEKETKQQLFELRKELYQYQNNIDSNE